jgi:hypothetical protein
MLPALFSLVISEMGVLCLAQAGLDHNPILFILPIDAHHHAQLFTFKMGSHEFFCPGWPGTSIFPISAFRVASITGMSHWCLAYCDYLKLAHP